MSHVIRFNYLYRDSGNYKKFGNKRYSNPDQLSYEEIEQNIIENLIDQMFFYPDQIGIIKFQFHRFREDFSWYDFESIELIEIENSHLKAIDPIDDLFLKLKEMKYCK